MPASDSRPGRFISFEGGEGSGKTTQIKRLADAIGSALGQPVLETREPGGSEGAEEIRRVLLTGDPGKFDAMSEALLLYAARRDHYTKKVKPATDRGTWVISDRFADSTMAYQGYAGNLGFETIKRLHRLVLGDVAPDLTIILDIDPKQGISRSLDRMAVTDPAEREDRFEKKDIAFHEALREGYLTIARSDRERCVVIDADQSVDAVSSAINKAVSERLRVSLG